MKIIIPGGNGQVGQMIVRAFQRRGDECVILTRQRPGASPQPDGVRTIVWDGKTLGPWADEIDGADVVINLAGRSVDCRYGARNLAAMMSSRVDSTRIVGLAIAAAKNPPRIWLQASTATIYAHRFDAPNDEETGKIGGQEPGVPALWAKSIAIAKAWEAELAAARTPRTRKVALRSAMTMSPDRGGVFSMLSRLCRMGVGRQGDGGQFVSWIHEDDFVAAVDFLIAREDLEGAINLCAPEPLTNRDFMKALRTTLGTKLSLPVPRWALEIGAFFLRTETELVLKSRWVVPARLLKAGFIFRHPRWPEAAEALISLRQNRSGRGALTPRGIGHEGEILRGEAVPSTGQESGTLRDKAVVGRMTSARSLTRKRRIALEIFGPAPIGALVWMIGASARMIWMKPADWVLALNSLLAFPILIPYAYFFAGIQSLVYMAIMEWTFARGLHPDSWLTVVLSTGLGLASGAVIVAAYGFDRPDVGELWTAFGGIGGSVGLVLSLVIKFHSKTRVSA